MKKNNLQVLFLIAAILFLPLKSLFSQNVAVANFDDYVNTDSLKAHWRVIGYSSLDFGLGIDSNRTPIGTRYLEYAYSGNTQTTWGGFFENTSLASHPLDLSSAKDGGIRFYLKGDGTANKMYIRLSNGTSNDWSSSPFTISDTNWHYVTIPFAVDANNGFTNGSKTLADLQTDLANITDLRVYIDHPNIDNIPYKVRFNAIYAVDKLPPDGMEIEDYENYTGKADLTAIWQFFGYSTADYYIMREPLNAQLGFKYLKYYYKAGSTTTWGSAFRLKAIKDTNFSNIAAGIEFYLKGDGTDNHIYLRLDNGNEMWASYFIPLKDTTWHLVKIGFMADTSVGFRYVGNDPNNGPVFTSNIGTTPGLYDHLKNITGLRIVLDHPTIDDVVHTLLFDGIYAVNAFSDGTILPVELTSFSAVNQGNSVELTWNTATEKNNKGFEIQRKLNSASGNWAAVGFVEGHGTSTKPFTYKFSDNLTKVQGSSFSYRLKQIDLDGTYNYSQEVNVNKEIVLKYQLDQNYPNPFNPTTTIKFSVAQTGPVTLKVFNILGSEVTTLVNEVKQAGQYQINFNAQKLSSGVYFYTLQSGNFTQTKKLILIK